MQEQEKYKNHNHIAMYCSDCGYKTIRLLNCGDRLCPVCKEDNYKRLLVMYSPIIKKVPFHRLSQITLTHKNQKYLTRSSVRSILSDFNKLRRSSFFKRYVKGGLAVVECKHRSDFSGWNLHIHILVDSSFIPQKSLSRLWHSITGHSYIVDVRKEEKSSSAIFHLLKYFNKVPIIQGFDVSSLEKDFNDAFRGIRTVISFGSFYLNEKKYLPKCPKCGCDKWITEFDLNKKEKYAYKIRGAPFVPV